jgi:hypothetical protein
MEKYLNKNFIKKDKLIFRQILKRTLKSCKINFNNLYLGLKRNSDISGIKFRLVGRTRFTRSNQRSFYKSSVYGSLMVTRHSSLKLIKPITPFIPMYRGHVKGNIDYNLSFSRSSSGTFSLKV